MRLWALPGGVGRLAAPCLTHTVPGTPDGLPVLSVPCRRLLPGTGPCLARPQALTLTAVRKDDKADLSLRSVYNYGNYGFTAIFNTSDKVNVTATIDKVGGQAGRKQRRHSRGCGSLLACCQLDPAHTGAGQAACWVKCCCNTLAQGCRALWQTGQLWPARPLS